MWRVLSVSRSGYYPWLGCEPSKRTRANAVLLETIEKVHEDRDGRDQLGRVRFPGLTGHGRVERVHQDRSQSLLHERRMLVLVQAAAPHDRLRRLTSYIAWGPPWMWRMRRCVSEGRRFRHFC